MAIQTQPSRISEPFAGSGTKNVIPATNTTPSASQAASWASGFPPECSQPISVGGCPVPRDDMNGVLNWLSQGFSFRQDGGIWEWSALADYDLQRVVRGSDGLLYWSVAQSGPGVVAGAQDPTTDTSHTYWISPKVPTMPADDNSKAVVNSEWVSAWYAGRMLPSDLYVDAVNGDDSNDGFTVGTPKKTIQAAEDLLRNHMFLKPDEVTIHVAAGTYNSTGGYVIQGVFGVSEVFRFEQGSILTAGIGFSGSGKTVTIVGELTFSGNFWACFDIELGSVLNFGGAGESVVLNFDNVTSTRAMYASGGKIVTINGTSSFNINFTGTCSFSDSVVYSVTQGLIGFNSSVSWVGSATGKRYHVAELSILRGVGGPNVIPGTTAGTVDSTSFFS